MIWYDICQIISESNYLVLNSSKKANKKLLLYRSVNFEMSFWYNQFFIKMYEKFDYGTSSRIVFVRFLEELKTPKGHFDGNQLTFSCSKSIKFPRTQEEYNFKS